MGALTQVLQVAAVTRVFQAVAMTWLVAQVGAVTQVAPGRCCDLADCSGDALTRVLQAGAVI